MNALNNYLEIIFHLKNKTTNDFEKSKFWLELHDKYKKNGNNNLSLGIAMALIHPDFPDVIFEKRTGFRKPISNECELGKLVSGAKCPNSAFELDHIWPISLGGITEDRNRADLCRDCNRGKSNTIVGYFPWGGNIPNWVIEKIDIIRSGIGL
jgi:hypothetical protein